MPSSDIRRPAALVRALPAATHARTSVRLLLALLAATAATLLPGVTPSVHGQTAGSQTVSTPEVVSRMVSVGPDEARLTLELTSGRVMALTLTDGEIRMGDEVLGSYVPGSALDQSWRELVAASLALDEEALLEALVDWSPPEDLSGAEAEAAARLDEFLTESFDTTAIREMALRAQEDAAAVSDAVSGLESLELLTRLDRLTGLSETLRELDTRGLRVVVDDHLEISAGDEFDGSVLVVDGSLEVAGTIRGDVVVVDGDVELLPGSRITGELTLTSADLDDEGGTVDGGIRRQTRDLKTLEERIREQVMSEMDGNLNIQFENERGRGFMAPVRRIFGGLGDIIGKVFQILILGGIGVLLLNFAGPNLESIAETARRETGRSALVGLAGVALVLPVWILGIVGLAVTIIGIPAILLWLPLFPAAVMFAGLVGYLAVAHNLGIWLSRQGYAWADWVRVTHPGTLIFGGLILLTLPKLAAEVLGMVGFLDVFAVLLSASGAVFGLFAAAVGFGAVIITRGGRQSDDWGSDLFTRPFRNTRWGRDRGWGDDDIMESEPPMNPAHEAGPEMDEAEGSAEGADDSAKAADAGDDVNDANEWKGGE